jgi:hypothetical protein
MIRSTLPAILLVLALAAAAPGTARAGQNPPAPPPAAEDDPDRDPNPSQPDFTIVNLPTTLRVPRFKSAFRVTHRFGRPLGEGTFGDAAENLFGLDAGAIVGLEYRFGLMRGLQIGILRTSNRTIDFFTQYNVMQQGEGRPLGIGLIASVEGTNNFRDSYTPSIGLAVSRELWGHGALYVEPMWVNNANPLSTELGGENDTFMLGLGARLRVRPNVYLVGEFIPRSGYAPGVHHATFGIERRAGGHVFQFNFSDGLGNTPGQLARGGTRYEDWYIGFNIARKFF